ncbi:hypothetical protein, partial [Thermomonas carbonis]
MTTHAWIWMGLLALVLPLAAAAGEGSATPISVTEGSSRVVAVTAGGNHSCGLRADGSAVCWGDNLAGQVLPPAAGDRAKMAGPFVSLSAGLDHTCGLKSDGTAACWGSNGWNKATPGSNSGYVQLGAGDDFTCGRKSSGSLVCWGHYNLTSPPSAGRQFIDLATGSAHACALMANGNAYCWGSDTSGEAPGYTSTQSSKTGPFLALAAGKAFTCGLKANAEVQCWGAGIGGNPPAGSFIALAAGDAHACALRTDGEAVCWGDNSQGQAQPATGGPFLALAAGAAHACALRADGAVDCWGRNDEGQRVVATEMGEAAFGQIAAGNAHACQVLRDGRLGCWGRNDALQATVPSGTYTQVAAGDTQSCAIDSTGTIVCWGADAANLAAAFSDKAWRLISMGQSGGLCAVPVIGELVRCRTPAGVVSNRAGKLGDSIVDAPVRTMTYVSNPAGGFCAAIAPGSTTSTTTYTTGYCTPGISYPGGRWQSLASGLWHTCAVQTNGVLQCFGAFSQQTTIPAPHNTYLYRAVSVGTSHSCAIRDNGSLYCWGDSTNGKLNAPPGTFVQVAAGNTFTCAIRSDGIRLCWGDNAAGQAPQLSLQPTTIQGTAEAGIAYPATTFGLVVANGNYSPPTPAYGVLFGSLPPGLTLAANGSLSGTPTAGGDFTFTVEGEDANGLAARGTYTISIPIADSTPPAISYTLNGIAAPPASPDGGNGWYVSDVAVAWTVIDPESGIASSTGCAASTLTGDATGASASCTATNGVDLDAAVTTVPVNIDVTTPTIAVSAAPAANGSGWNNSDVTASYTCTDGTSGIASCPNDQVLSTEGIGIASTFQTAKDVAGNVSEASNVVTVNIDKTAPTITAAATTAPNANGWHDGDVTIRFSCSDATSGLASACPADQTLTGEGTGIASTAQTIQDTAGNSGSSNVVMANIDRTAPVLAPTLPGLIL